MTNKDRPKPSKEEAERALPTYQRLNDALNETEAEKERREVADALGDMTGDGPLTSDDERLLREQVRDSQRQNKTV